MSDHAEECVKKDDCRDVQKEESSGGRCVWGGIDLRYPEGILKSVREEGEGENYIKPCLKAEAVKKKIYAFN